MEEPSLTFLGGISNWPHIWKSWWGGRWNSEPHHQPLKINKISAALPTLIEKSVLKIDLSPLNWIKDPKIHQDVCQIARRVAGLFKFKAYGLPVSVSSKEDIRDILVSLGWPVQLELSSHEIADIKNFEVGNNTLKVVDVCLVPHTSGHRHFVCIRIRRSVVQGDCTNTPLHLIKHENSSRSTTTSKPDRVLKTQKKKIPVQKTKNSIKKKNTNLSLKRQRQQQKEI